MNDEWTKGAAQLWRRFQGLRREVQDRIIWSMDPQQPFAPFDGAKGDPERKAGFFKHYRSNTDSLSVMVTRAERDG